MARFWRVHCWQQALCSGPGTAWPGGLHGQCVAGPTQVPMAAAAPPHCTVWSSPLTCPPLCGCPAQLANGGWSACPAHYATCLCKKGEESFCVVGAQTGCSCPSVPLSRCHAKAWPVTALQSAQRARQPTCKHAAAQHCVRPPRAPPNLPGADLSRISMRLPSHDDMQVPQLFSMFDTCELICQDKPRLARVMCPPTRASSNTYNPK